MLQDRKGLSERRACQIVGQHRSTQRREPCVAQDDAALRTRLRRFSRDRPRWGYRRAHAQLREEGWQVNASGCSACGARKVCAFLCAGASATGSASRPCPPSAWRRSAPNHVWALDFQFDQTADGQILKLLHIVDEFTREALDVLCERRIDADRTVGRAERLVLEHGAPEHVRCDNGP
jgi:putative transposase